MRNRSFVERPLSDARLASPARHVLQPSLRAFVSPSQEPVHAMTRLRNAVLLSLLAAVALAVAACGGGDSEDQASSSSDVNELLTQTFTGSKQVKSGNLDVALKLEAQGGDSELDGPISITLAGPFQAQEGGKLPKFHLDAAFDGAGQSIKAGATSTGEQGFLSFQGTDYVVDDQVFRQFKAGFEEAQKQGSGAGNQSFASLGMDPRKWLTDPKNEGEAKVGDDDTIKITGGVDVAKLLDDVNNALEQASALGLGSAGQVPEKLTEEQKRQVVEGVKDPRVEIYTGKDDTILRRMVVNFGIDDKSSDTSGSVAFDISITDLNEDQDIAEPSDAKPFSDLLGQLGGLGIGAGAPSSGSGSSGGSAAPSGAGSAEDLDKFSKCLNEAGDDADKARKCAELLSG
jgi:hypothetical protein